MYDNLPFQQRVSMIAERDRNALRDELRAARAEFKADMKALRDQLDKLASAGCKDRCAECADDRCDACQGRDSRLAATDQRYETCCCGRRFRAGSAAS